MIYCQPIKTQRFIQWVRCQPITDLPEAKPRNSTNAYNHGSAVLDTIDVDSVLHFQSTPSSTAPTDPPNTLVSLY
jgi:hypothetical protein